MLFCSFQVPYKLKEFSLQEEHEQALSFVDSATRSKTLITTRIRGLGGAAQVELGVPSESEAIGLLLSSAGLAATLSSPPPEAAEIVAICGRLPLAVDLAGKMLRDLGVEAEDWTGVPKLLREEMHAGNERETTLEYRVISASLNSVPARDRANVRKVFNVFALVAEDTFVPMAAFRILLSAVTGTNDLAPELQVRRWLQILISRSVVLGTIGKFGRMHWIF
eukprot:SAG31_NODE_5483_length_2513_cov_2.273405_4_plen_222_part_00